MIKKTSSMAHRHQLQLEFPILRFLFYNRVRFARKSDAVISMKVTTCPTQEVFNDPFPLELESLFWEHNLQVLSTTFSSTKATTVEPINTLVELTEWSMLVQDTRALLVDISGQLGSIGRQGSNQDSQVEVVGLVEAASLVKNGSIPDENDRDISSFSQMACWLVECAQRDYVHEADHPEMRENLCSKQTIPYNPGNRNTGHPYQTWEFKK